MSSKKTIIGQTTSSPAKVSSLPKKGTIAPNVGMTSMSNTSMSVTEATIEQYAPQNYLAYAMFTATDRAIPLVADGLKPVQRRILYTMKELHLEDRAKAMKSARVVGQVLGKYHPHGDSSVYDAMVHLAQPFAMRYPLVHGEGNFGSRDGDRAAAYRYTEAKLHPIAETFLSELGASTVDFQANYDGKEQEPKTLPSRLPFLLLNGASGIAVGLATEIPSHNLREVGEATKLLLANPKKTTFEDFIRCVPGPDFATGSTLISSPTEIAEVYREGRGSVRLRAKYEAIKETTGRHRNSWKLAFTEIPQLTSTANIIKRIAELMDPPAKEKNGKKLALSPTAMRLKKLFSEAVASVIDGSGKDTGAVYLVVSPKDTSLTPEQLASLLFTYTDLEMNYPINFTAIDQTGSPRQLSPFGWLQQWCDYRVLTVNRRLNHELSVILHRLHVLAGRLLALANLTAVIEVIVNSEQPKTDLMARFSLTEIQAEDILDIRLRQLAKLEKAKLLSEQQQLQIEKTRLEKLLGSDKLLRKEIIKELDADLQAYGDARRTQLAPASASVVVPAATQSLIKSHDPLSVVLSDHGWLAWKPARDLGEALDNDYKLKSGDTVIDRVYGTRDAELLLLDKLGRGYALSPDELSLKADTAVLSVWFQTIDFTSMVLALPSNKFLLAGSQGYGFITTTNFWSNNYKNGKALLTLQPTESPLLPLLIPDATTFTQSLVVVLSSDGSMVAYPLAEVKQMSKGKGVALIGLRKGCLVNDLLIISPNSSLELTDQRKTYKISWEAIQTIVGPRSAGRKGKRLVSLKADFTKLKFIRAPACFVQDKLDSKLLSIGLDSKPKAPSSDSSGN